MSKKKKEVFNKNLEKKKEEKARERLVRFKVLNNCPEKAEKIKEGPRSYCTRFD